MTTLRPSQHTSNKASMVKLQHGKLAFTFEIETLSHGLIPTLQMLGYRLYHGYLNRDVFLHKIANKSSMIESNNRLVTASLAKQNAEFDQLDDKKKIEIESLLDSMRDTVFARYMTKISMTENWKTPVIINRSFAGQLQQVTGKTRAFATMMTKSDPWIHYPVLLLDHCQNDINEVLENPIHCHNDTILHEVFGMQIGEENSWEPELVIDIDVAYNKGSIICNMTNIHNGVYYDKYQGQGQDQFDSHVAWRKKVGACPTLYIHTDHPENIKDLSKQWSTKIVPLNIDQDFRRECANRPAWLEKLVHSYHNNPTHESNAFVLWVLDDRHIDLRDLAWWGDNDTNVMIDSDWKFIMYQPSAEYCSKFIKISQAK